MANINWKHISLDDIRNEKIAELKKTCDETILGRFKVILDQIEYEFSYDEKAQSRFNGIGLMFTRGIITTEEWTAYQNGERLRILLSSDDFDTVAIAAALHTSFNVKKYNDLLVTVFSLNEPDEIRAVTWE